jgi:hypothetical protein
VFASFTLSEFLILFRQSQQQIRDKLLASDLHFWIWTKMGARGDEVRTRHERLERTKSFNWRGNRQLQRFRLERDSMHVGRLRVPIKKHDTPIVFRDEDQDTILLSLCWCYRLQNRTITTLGKDRMKRNTAEESIEGLNNRFSTKTIVRRHPARCCCCCFTVGQYWLIYSHACLPFFLLSFSQLEKACCHPVLISHSFTSSSIEFIYSLFLLPSGSIGSFAAHSCLNFFFRKFSTLFNALSHHCLVDLLPPLLESCIPSCFILSCFLFGEILKVSRVFSFSLPRCVFPTDSQVSSSVIWALKPLSSWNRISFYW